MGSAPPTYFFAALFEEAFLFERDTEAGGAGVQQRRRSLVRNLDRPK